MDVKTWPIESAVLVAAAQARADVTPLTSISTADPQAETASTPPAAAR